ncbi:MAG: RNA polymerase sigma factor [Flavobacteriales bacterium]|nr:RNA polymerase sigma factor [Flavobacteriales bacterium]
MSTDPRTEFMKAYQPCHEPFVRYCSALAYGKMDVQDLMQDVLLGAFQRFEQIRKKDELLHYLIRAAKNRAVSHWRVQRRNEEVSERQMARLKERGASAETLLDAQLLYGAIDKLPADQRDALVLFEVSGLSMAEIAVIHNSTEGAVKVRVSRARAAVRAMMQGRAKPVHAGMLHTLTSFML